MYVNGSARDATIADAESARDDRIMRKMYGLAAASIILGLCLPAIGLAQLRTSEPMQGQSEQLRELRGDSNPRRDFGDEEARPLQGQSERLRELRDDGDDDDDSDRRQDVDDEELEPMQGDFERSTVLIEQAEPMQGQSEQLRELREQAGEEEEEAWRLFDKSRWLKKKGLLLRGTVAQGFTWNPANPADRSNGTLAFNYRANDYLFDQLHLYLEKPFEEDSDSFQIGGMIESFYGTDSLFTQTIGLDDFWFSGNMGFILPQFYLSAYLPVGNGVTVKIGHFWGLLGYEGTAALSRQFYSSSNTNVILEPNTDTGVQVIYSFSDNWSLNAALTRGLDVWDDNNDRLGFTESLIWLSDDGDTSIGYAMYYDGLCLSCSAADEHVPQYLGSLVLEHKLQEDLTYVFWHDHGIADDPSIGDANARWYSIVQYLLYDVSENWSANARLEWVRDEDGFLMASSNGDLWGLTLGLNYKPSDNLFYRPEIRWDWSHGLTPPLFDDNTRNNQFTAAMDVVVIF